MMDRYPRLMSFTDGVTSTKAESKFTSEHMQNILTFKGDGTLEFDEKVLVLTKLGSHMDCCSVTCRRRWWRMRPAACDLSRTYAGP